MAESDAVRYCSRITAGVAAATIALIATVPHAVAQVDSSLESLPATQDAYVLSGAPDVNYGGEDRSLIKLSRNGRLDRHAYYQFDLCEYEAGVNSAIFEVRIKAGHCAGLSVHVSDQTWQETEITWSSQPALPTSAQAVTIGRNGKSLAIDVTDPVNALLAKGRCLLTLALHASEPGSQALALATRESSSASDRPQLLVQPMNHDAEGGSKRAFEFGTHFVAAKGDPGAPYFNFKSDYLEEVNIRPAELSAYGGWKEWSLGATGYFRTQKVDGNWTVVDPEGHAFLAMGMNSVHPGGELDLPAALKGFGVNSMGSWSDESIDGIPYTPRWNFLQSFKNTTDELKAQYLDVDKNILPVFEPGFPVFVDQVAQGAAAYRDDPYVFGHYTDNEISLHRNVQLINCLSRLEPGNPQYAEADKWMRSKYGGSYRLGDITSDDELAYLGHVADTYYRTVSEALRKYDPNHMVLGTRLHASSKYNDHIVRAAGRYTDILSVNYYGVWAPELSTAVKMWNAEAGIPFIVTEFYTKAEDSGLDNSNGAGWIVKDQKGRSAYFENFALKLLSAPNNVGWHWFRLVDDDGSNKGAYSGDYLEAYAELQSSMRQVARHVYSLRSTLLTGTLDFDGQADDR